MSHHRRPLIGSLALSAVIVAGFAVAEGQSSVARATSDSSWVVDRADTFKVNQMTGDASPNRTGERWGVNGTDLGSMFLHKGKTVLLFGDTFGSGAPPNDDWRSNVLGRSSDRDPSDGLTIDSMVTDRPGHAKELIDQSAVPGTEVTVIPTNGVSVGGRMYLHYMAVRSWDSPGRWTLNRSGLAYSDDDGQNWTVSPDVVWPGDSNFGQVAFVKKGRYVYLFGIPGGRFGGVQLARVPRRQLLDLTSYRYWDGAGWVPDPAAAETVAEAPAGELSVQWNSYYRTWLMTYLNEDKAAVVLRTADRLTGPWSDQQVVVTATEAPALYAPYLPPRWNNGKDIYFALSQFGPYNVFWWHTSLDRAP